MIPSSTATVSYAKRKNDISEYRQNMLKPLNVTKNVFI